MRLVNMRDGGADLCFPCVRERDGYLTATFRNIAGTITR
jgi:hypothetical protein